MEFCLDNVKMNVIQTADNGIVNHETIFLFSQNKNTISAKYAGGKILMGFLVGKFTTDNQFAFSYAKCKLMGHSIMEFPYVNYLKMKVEKSYSRNISNGNHGQASLGQIFFKKFKLKTIAINKSYNPYITRAAGLF